MITIRLSVLILDPFEEMYQQSNFGLSKVPLFPSIFVAWTIGDHFSGTYPPHDKQHVVDGARFCIVWYLMRSLAGRDFRFYNDTFFKFFGSEISVVNHHSI